MLDECFQCLLLHSELLLQIVFLSSAGNKWDSSAKIRIQEVLNSMYQCCHRIVSCTVKLIHLVYPRSCKYDLWDILMIYLQIGFIMHTA